MSRGATHTAALFSELLRGASSDDLPDRRPARRLLAPPDPMDRLVTTKLLGESLGRLLSRAGLPPHPVVLLMDRLGGGDGVKAAQAVIARLSEIRPGAGLVHVAFSTPSRGLGALLRSTLARAGATSGILVEAVCEPRAAEGLELDEDATRALFDSCDISLTLCPGGAAGLLPMDGTAEDLLLSSSSSALLSFPDPEALVARLDALRAAASAAVDMDEVVIRASSWEDGDWIPVAECVLEGASPDAGERLWQILDNVKRRLYRMDLIPRARGKELAPLVCPCRTAIERGAVAELTSTKVIPASDHLLVSAIGRRTLM